MMEAILLILTQAVFADALNEHDKSLEFYNKALNRLTATSEPILYFIALAILS